MAKDYTKYTVEGLGEDLNKRKLVFTIVKDYVKKNNPSFEDLQKAFPDEVQGSKGFIRKETEVKDPKRFNMREPLKIKNGAHVVVSNQWGENINDFIAASEKLGYHININDQDSRQEKQQVSSYPEKCLECGLEPGPVYQLKTSPFDPIDSYQRILDEFNLLYNGGENNQPLFFKIVGAGPINVFADTYMLKWMHENLDADEVAEDEFVSFLENMKISSEVIEILKEMWKDDEWYVVDIIKYIALPGQVIEIQYSDSKYGNNEFEVET